MKTLKWLEDKGFEINSSMDGTYGKLRVGIVDISHNMDGEWTEIPFEILAQCNSDKLGQWYSPSLDLRYSVSRDFDKLNTVATFGQKLKAAVMGDDYTYDLIDTIKLVKFLEDHCPRFVYDQREHALVRIQNVMSEGTFNWRDTPEGKPMDNGYSLVWGKGSNEEEAKMAVVKKLAEYIGKYSGPSHLAYFKRWLEREMPVTQIYESYPRSADYTVEEIMACIPQVPK
jgi:hypothetical protein